MRQDKRRLTSPIISVRSKRNSTNAALSIISELNSGDSGDRQSVLDRMKNGYAYFCPFNAVFVSLIPFRQC